MTADSPTVVQRWLTTAASAGEAPAVRDDGYTRSHAELLDLARRRAALLLARGLGREQRVVVMLGSGVEQATWIAAVMLAGGCAVAVGTGQPEQRVRTLMELARPALVVADATTRHLAPGDGVVDGADPGVPPGGPPPATWAAGAAYLCFTSGTTGLPKGVIVPHGAIAHTTAQMSAHLDLASRRRTHVLTTSWSFDVAMMDLWLALTSGGTLYVPDRARLLGPALVETVAPLEAPVVHGVPSLFGAFGAHDYGRLPAGTTVMLGGESLPGNLLRDLRKHAELHAVYGITETGVVTTTHRVTAETTPDVIGVPLPGVDCVITDSSGAEVPDGVSGELRIGGPVLARGYLGDPAGTEARFVTDGTGGRRYRTGDLVRRRPDGALSFLGRIDHQVKIRGYRVEPTEIEQAMLALPGVRQAAVVLRDGPAGEPALAGYLTGTGADPEAVRRALADRLPEWMVPAAVQVLPRMPVSVTGKVDRDALPEPRWHTRAAAAGEGTDDGPAELTGTERVIGGLWQQLLGTDRVAAEDNFLALGGHSLKAAQLSTALRDRVGVAVPVVDVLTAGSLRSLAALVDRAPRLPTAPSAGRAGGTDGVSPVQRQIWLHQELADRDGIYNLVFGLRLRGRPHPAALQRALHETEAAHPALRRSYAFDGEELTAVPSPATALPLPVLRSTDPAERVAEAGRVAIDLSAGPPWRYELIEQTEEDHLLLLTLHHLAVDGVAVYRVLEEIGRRYSALVGAPDAGAGAAGVPAPAGAGGPDAAADRAFWESMFAGAPAPLTVPGQRPAADPGDFVGWCLPVSLPGLDPGALRRTAAAAGVTAQALVLTAFLRSLAGTAGTRDLIVGVPLSRRGVDVAAGEIGQFVSVLPVRFTLPAGLAARDCLTTVAQTMRAAQRHCALDPAVVVEAARRGQGGAATDDPFHVVFAWEDEQPAPRFAGLDCSWRLEFNGWSETDLTIELADTGGTVAGRVVGRAAAGARNEAAALMAALGTEIRALGAELAGEVVA
ncbi:amino acid adenylation domain-containing protein [Streptomyces carpaticus]|uniref:amino acid adenylation domain-containing protein n=1 Tax=Streptomyces carpaticus TaxID=285558 RepID=UPI00220EC7FC|nr:amino acid adenylation domain-containing protein [Streptomyces carpaticus]